MAEWCRMFRVSLTDFPGQDYSKSLFRKEWTSTFKCQTSSVHRISGLDHAECGELQSTWTLMQRHILTVYEKRRLTEESHVTW